MDRQEQLGSETDCEPDELGNVVSHRAYGVKNDDGKCTGYFYLSYYDRSIVGQETMEFSSNLLGEGAFFTLQHDYLPANGGFYSTDQSQNVISSANVFEVDENVSVRSVSTRTAQENMRVTMAIYALDEGAASPTDGKLLRRISTNFECSGFHRVDLDVPVDVKKGQRIAVVSTTSQIDEAGTREYVASANMAPKEKSKGTFVAVVNEGESYLYRDNVWTDWKSYLGTAEDIGENVVDNFSIKLYATPAEADEGQSIYRLYNPNSGEHFYTASSDERVYLASVGWNDEGLGWVAPTEEGDPVFRLYNPYAGDHHYTTSVEERDQLVSVGWNDEGTGWFSAGEDGTPLFRQYNPNATVGTHNYTTSEVERDARPRHET